MVAWALVLLVMPTGWFVCLSARGVGAGVGRLPVRVVVGALGAWWAWPGAGVRVGVYVARAAGGLRASGALLPCVWWFVLSGGAWPVCALRGCCGVWSAWVVSVWVFGVGAGCGRVVRVVQSGVMVVPLAASMVTVLQVVSLGRWCWRFPVWVV